MTAQAESPEHGEAENGDRDDRAAREQALTLPFGADFFLQQLRGFVRDCCPTPDAGLPHAELHLSDGDVLDLCHIVAVGPAWVALAVNERDRQATTVRMRTEIVPYACIMRVTIGAAAAEGSHIGFDSRHVPVTVEGLRPHLPTPADALRAAAQGGPIE